MAETRPLVLAVSVSAMGLSDAVAKATPQASNMAATIATNNETVLLTPTTLLFSGAEEEG